MKKVNYFKILLSLSLSVVGAGVSTAQERANPTAVLGKTELGICAARQDTVDVEKAQEIMKQFQR